MTAELTHENDEIQQLSIRIFDKTVVFTDLAVQISGMEQADLSVHEELHHQAEMLEALNLQLIGKPNAEIQIALACIAKQCAAEQRWWLWNHIRQKIAYYAQQACIDGRYSSICLLPVNVAIHSAYAGTSFRLSDIEKSDIAKTLHDFQLIHPHIQVSVVSDLLSQDALELSIESIQHLAIASLQTTDTKKLPLPATWKATSNPHTIEIPEDIFSVVETRFLVVILSGADSDDNYGIIQELWNSMEGSDVPEADLLDELCESWSDTLQALLPDPLSALPLLPEPVPLALDSANHLLNKSKLEACIELHDLDGKDVYCLTTQYGEPSTLGDGAFGLMLHLFRKDDATRLDILSYCRDNEDFFDEESFNVFYSILQSLDIEYRGLLPDKDVALS